MSAYTDQFLDRSQQQPYEEEEEVVEVYDDEVVECTPGMLLHPMGLLRMFELAMFFILQWLVQITCGGDACTMIMNVFGYTALGQVFVLIIFLALSLPCGIILVLFSLNGHRALRGMLLAVEKLYAVLGIVLMFICGLLGTWMAILTNDPEVNYQGRGVHHIKGQWIAAAVLEFLMVGVYVFDLWMQRGDDYPFGIKDYQSEAAYVSTTIEKSLPLQETFNPPLNMYNPQMEYNNAQNFEQYNKSTFNQFDRSSMQTFEQPPTSNYAPSINNQMNFPAVNNSSSV